MSAFFKILLLLLVVFLGVTFPKNSFAQTSTISATKASSNYSPQSPQFMNIVLINLIHTLSCLGEGASVLNQPCINLFSTGTDPKSPLVPYEVKGGFDGGALGSIGTMMNLAYIKPPLRTVEYLGELREKLGIVKPVFAQVGGSGSGVIAPVKKIWELTRNISYFGMTAVFLVIGFMIMLRRKLNPQTVISAQAALPGLVVTLILITFSYFITALMVDMTFVGTQLAGKVLVSQGLTEETKTDDLLSQGNVLSVFDKFLFGNIGDLVSTTTNIFTFLHESPAGKFITTLEGIGTCLLVKEFTPDVQILGNKIDLKTVTCLTSFAGVELLGNIFPSAMGKFTGSLFGIFLYAVLLFALLIAMFKVLFAVINSYISIIILTITGPIRFMLGAIPGSKGGFSSWLKELAGNVLIFPALYAIFFLAAYLQGPGWQNNPLGGNPFGVTGYETYPLATIPLLGGLPGTVIPLLLSYGLLLLSPNIPDLVKNALGVKDAGYGKMAFGAAMSGFGITRGLLNKTIEPFKKDRQNLANMAQQAMYEPNIQKKEEMIDAYTSAKNTSNPLRKWLYKGIKDYGFVGDKGRNWVRILRTRTAWERARDQYLAQNPGRTEADYITAGHPEPPKPPPHP